ncbi:MAG: T9SS type A sorting domain-containing protein [Crocinitomicaceae bacterium]|nr:T9SS type A sorting domain-containing protein [Crocinitomicaceae bacterium]
MRKTILFASFLLSSFSFSQGNDLLWATGFGSTEFDMVKDIAVDSDGNVISVGQFRGTADFDPGAGVFNLTSAGLTDFFVMKQDSDGNLVWVHGFGGTDSDAANGVDVDNNDNIYITGMYRFEVDFDPGPGDYTIGNWGASAGQIFLLKLNSDGDLQWVNSMGNTVNSSQGFCIAVEPTTGTSVISGVFYGTVDFDPSAGTTSHTANTSTNYDIFLATYGTDGGYGTSYGFGGDAGTNRPYSLSLDVANSILLTGTFGGTIDLDPTAGTQSVTSNGNDDIFMMKWLAGGGTFLWGKSIGGIYSDLGSSVTSDSNEDIYFSGAYYDAIDLNPNAGVSTYTTGGMSTYIIKLAWDGTYIWSTEIDGGYSGSWAMDTDENDDLYILGGYSLTTDFDPDAGTVNHTSTDNFDDIYLVKLDQDGLYQWSKSFGAINDDRGNSIEVVSSNEIFIGGYYTNNIDFNPTGSPVVVNAIGTVDNFVAKFGTCGLDLSVSLSGATLTANQSGASYQWMDCNAFAPVGGATSQSFSPSADGDYAVIITQGSCKDTSNCTTVSGVGINEINKNFFTVYPNPAQTNLTVQTTENILSINIFNSAGTLVRTENKNTFSVESLPAGIYLMQIQTENEIQQSKFIKQ